MDQLPKEIRDRLNNEGREYSIQSGFGRDEDSYIAGATAEAVRAMPLVDSCEALLNAPLPSNESEMTSWIETARMMAQAALSSYTGERPIPETEDQFIERHLTRIKQLQKELKEKFEKVEQPANLIPNDLLFEQWLGKKGLFKTEQGFEYAIPKSVGIYSFEYVYKWFFSETTKEQPTQQPTEMYHLTEEQLKEYCMAYNNWWWEQSSEDEVWDKFIANRQAGEQPLKSEG